MFAKLHFTANIQLSRDELQKYLYMSCIDISAIHHDDVSAAVHTVIEDPDNPGQFPLDSFLPFYMV